MIRTRFLLGAPGRTHRHCGFENTEPAIGRSSARLHPNHKPKGVGAQTYPGEGRFPAIKVALNRSREPDLTRDSSNNAGGPCRRRVVPTARAQWTGRPSEWGMKPLDPLACPEMQIRDRHIGHERTVGPQGSSMAARTSPRTQRNRRGRNEPPRTGPTPGRPPSGRPPPPAARGP